MDLESDRGPVELIALGSGVAGILLLLAPWTPPQLAIFAFVGLFVLGVAVYVGVGITTDILYAEADRRLPEEPDEFEEIPVGDDVMHSYLDGEMTDAELEQEIERAIEEEES